MLEFDTECSGLHGSGASALLEGEVSGRLGGLHELALLGGFGVGLAPSLGGIASWDFGLWGYWE